MNYLIFRTDRIGDFLITSPLLNSIKNNDKEAKIYIVASNKNLDFIKKTKLAEKIFLLKDKSLISRIKLYIQIKKFNFDRIIVADKKNRSLILTLFIKSKKKIFNVSKLFQKKILSYFYKDVFLDNDKQKNLTVKDILSKNCNSLGFKLVDDNFHFFKKKEFENDFFYKEFFNPDEQDYLIFHYDEKWEIDNYIKIYNKASNLTNIKINFDDFLKFLKNLIQKTSKTIIITTGMLKTDLIDNLIIKSKKIHKGLFQFDLKEGKIYLVDRESFFVISHLISCASSFISCHGAFTHIASNYRVKIIDIVEEGREYHYKRITDHMKNYKRLTRNNFSNLSKEILNYS